MRGRLAVILMVGFSLRLLSQATGARSDDVAVVVSENNPVNELSVTELRKILAGDRHSWPGGLPVKLFVRAPGTHERLVLLDVLHMSESEYKQYWIAKVFRGEAQSEPAVLPSNGMQKEALASFPGGIALVDAEDVKSPMKVLKIDGRLPGQPGYPLH